MSRGAAFLNRPDLNEVRPFSHQQLRYYKEKCYEQRTVCEETARLSYFTEFRAEQLQHCKNVLVDENQALMGGERHFLEADLDERRRRVDMLRERVTENGREIAQQEAEISRLTQLSLSGAVVPREDFQVQTQLNGKDVGISIRRAQSITTMCANMQDFRRKMLAAFEKKFPSDAALDGPVLAITRQESMPSVFIKHDTYEEERKLPEELASDAGPSNVFVTELSVEDGNNM